MGMFNEVYYPCPECNGRGYMQVSQIVMGFGDFHLDDLDTLSELSAEDLVQLKEEVLENSFCCESCGRYFNPYTTDKPVRTLAWQLFTPPGGGDDG